MTISLSALTPGAGGGAGIDFQEFTSNGTWTKPDDVTWVEVEVIGGGGGGGSGRKGASGNKSGGTGGWGSTISRYIFAASAIGATETITIAAGGIGGAAVTTNSTNGNDGTDGGVSSFGGHISSGAGTKGKGALSTDTFGAVSYSNALPFTRNNGDDGTPINGGPGHGIAGSNTGRNRANTAPENWCGGGGGGGGTSSSVITPGGDGGCSTNDLEFASNAGTNDGASGGNVNSGQLRGAGGGAGSLLGNAGNGGNGSIGGGGGGGGASLDNVGNSGAGGNGGSGRIRVWAW